MTNPVRQRRERRAACRFDSPADDPILVGIGAATLTARNVSRSGLQVGCGPAQYRTLAATLHAGSLDALLTLPGGATVRATCRCVYDYPVGDVQLIGLEFRSIGAADAARWETLLERLSAC